MCAMPTLPTMSTISAGALRTIPPGRRVALRRFPRLPMLFISWPQTDKTITKLSLFTPPRIDHLPQNTGDRPPTAPNEKSLRSRSSWPTMRRSILLPDSAGRSDFWPQTDKTITKLSLFAPRESTISRKTLDIVARTPPKENSQRSSRVRALCRRSQPPSAFRLVWANTNRTEQNRTDPNTPNSRSPTKHMRSSRKRLRLENFSEQLNTSPNPSRALARP